MHKTPIATVSKAFSSVGDIELLCTQLERKLEGSPDLIIASYTSLCDVDTLTRTIQARFPATPIMGGSTCRGAMTGDGMVAFGEANVALWGLVDAEGGYGVGFSQYQGSVEQAASEALANAIKQADREGELPDFVWIHSSPGCEEKVVATLDQLLGQDVSIVGGSAADEDLAARWSCFAGSNSTQNGVAVAVFYSSFEISSSFQCGYAPTQKTGVATRCEGRTVFEIDGRPAACVYNEWAGSESSLDSASLPRQYSWHEYLTAHRDSRWRLKRHSLLQPRSPGNLHRRSRLDFLLRD